MKKKVSSKRRSKKAWIRMSLPNQATIALSGRIVGYSAISLFSMLVLGLIFPIVSSEADAIDNTTTYAETRVAVKATASVAVSLANQVNIEVIPKANGAFGYSSTRLGVSTNNEEGYQIFLMTSDGSSILKNTDSSKVGANYEIASITEDLVGTSFSGNTWGYTLSKNAASENSTYSAVPTSNTSIYTTNTASATTEDVYHLGFGTHITTTLPAGEYSNSVVLSVVANPIKISSLSQLVFMQDMQPEFCTNAAEGTTKQLVDVRDGKKYWVAKLADGNCWMTQNLALDLSTDKALTPADSDVSESWVPGSSTKIGAPSEDDNSTSWDLGAIVLTNPTASTSCGNSLNGDITNCEWYKNVSGLASNFSTTSTSSISPDGLSYDAHYLIGNYYSWLVATADTGTDVVSPSSSLINPDDLADASSSICPRGWRLPTSGRYYQNDNSSYPFEREDSFMDLLMSYGYPAGNQTGWVANNGYPRTAVTGAGKTRLDYIPLYFVRSGQITSNSIYNAGSNGFYWSSTGRASSTESTARSTAYMLDFSTTSVHPTGYTGRSASISIRCLAR